MEEINQIKPHHSELTFYHKRNNLCKEHLNNQYNAKLLDRENIRILTYNIFLRPPLVKNNEDDWKDERLDDFLKMLHNYDIICLQELFGVYNSRKTKLIRAAVKNGFFYFVEADSPSFFSKYISDGGILILSRFPIKKYSSYNFTHGVLSDSIASKGALYAQIEVGNSLIHIFNVHTQASYSNDIPDLFIASFKTRMDQIDQLSKFIRDILLTEYNEKTDLTVLCGDLNVNAMRSEKISIVR